MTYGSFLMRPKPNKPSNMLSDCCYEVVIDGNICSACGQPCLTVDEDDRAFFDAIDWKIKRHEEER